MCSRRGGGPDTGERERERERQGKAGRVRPGLASPGWGELALRCHLDLNLDLLLLLLTPGLSLEGRSTLPASLSLGEGQGRDWVPSSLNLACEVVRVPLGPGLLSRGAASRPPSHLGRGVCPGPGTPHCIESDSDTGIPCFQVVWCLPACPQMDRGGELQCQGRRRLVPAPRPALPAHTQPPVVQRGPRTSRRSQGGDHLGERSVLSLPHGGPPY